MGTRGDIQPFVALGLTMHRRGWEVTIAAPVEFQDFINSFQVLHYAFIPKSVQTEVRSVKRGRSVLTASKWTVFLAMYRFFQGSLMSDWFGALVSACEQARPSILLLTTFFQISGCAAIEDLLPGVRCAYAHMYPDYPTRWLLCPSSNLGMDTGNRSLNGLSWSVQAWLYAHVFRPLAQRVVDAACRERDVARVVLDKRLNLSKLPMLFFYSPSLIPHPRDWPPNVHVLGPLFLRQPPRPEQMDPRFPKCASCAPQEAADASCRRVWPGLRVVPSPQHIPAHLPALALLPPGQRSPPSPSSDNLVEEGSEDASPPATAPLPTSADHSPSATPPHRPACDRGSCTLASCTHQSSRSSLSGSFVPSTPLGAAEGCAGADGLRRRSSLDSEERFGRAASLESARAGAERAAFAPSRRFSLRAIFHRGHSRTQSPVREPAVLEAQRRTSLSAGSLAAPREKEAPLLEDGKKSCPNSALPKTFTGRRAVASPLPPPVQAWLEEAAYRNIPVIYIGLGSMLSVALDQAGAARFLDACCRAVAACAAKRPVRGLIHTTLSAVNSACAAPRKREPGAAWMELDCPVDHAALLPRCALIVHHGGAGTVHAALAAGRPSLVLPCLPSSDQRFWGDAVAKAGLGPPPLPVHKVTARRLASALDRALDGLEGYAAAAQRMADSFRREDAALKTALLLESMLPAGARGREEPARANARVAAASCVPRS